MVMEGVSEGVKVMEGVSEAELEDVNEGDGVIVIEDV